MRLLSCSTEDNFELTTFDDESLPPYAILSHTWVDNQEVTYNEVVAGTGKQKAGYAKLRFCRERAAKDDLKYFWVDTCCINKATSEELGAAINSMFRWYQCAAKCYVFLSDVAVPHNVADPQLYRITWENALRRSRWFTRGWTLQELLAPASVEFFSKEGRLLGSKMSLEQEIHETTQIPVEVLRGQRLSKVSVDERMSWTARRKTTIKEDKAYCLLGIFGVFMPLIYGEGEDHAFLRLSEEVQKLAARDKQGEKKNLFDRFMPRERKAKSQVRTLEGHQGEVTAVAFSPNGALLASASSDNTVRLWDAGSGTLVRTLEGHKRSVWAVAFPPNGELLASASYDNTVRLWDAGSGAPVRTLEGHQDGVKAVAFSPNGALLASASYDNTVRLWDAGSGTPVRTLEGHQGGVTAVAFSPNGALLASASWDDTVRLWDAGSGAPVRTLEGHRRSVWAVAFSPDGALLASASRDNTIRLWDAGLGTLVRTLRRHQDWVRAVAFSPNGALLASASYDNTVRLWDVWSGAPVRTLEGHQDGVNAVAFSPHGAPLASASYDNTVRLWDAGSGAPV